MILFKCKHCIFRLRYRKRECTILMSLNHALVLVELLVWKNPSPSDNKQKNQCIDISSFLWWSELKTSFLCRFTSSGPGYYLFRHRRSHLAGRGRERVGMGIQFRPILFVDP